MKIGTNNRLPKKMDEWMPKGQRKKNKTKTDLDTGCSSDNERKRIGEWGLRRQK